MILKLKVNLNEVFSVSQAVCDEKLGDPLLPPHLTVEQFDRIQSGLGSVEEISLLKECYREDFNAVPPIYILCADVDVSGSCILNILKHSNILGSRFN